MSSAASLSPLYTYYEHANKPPGFIKCEKFFDHLRFSKRNLLFGIKYLSFVERRHQYNARINSLHPFGLISMLRTIQKQLLKIPCCLCSSVPHPTSE
jgi:hypothetical protein